MITRFTKFQLLFFAIITIIGAVYVGGRYAEVDRIFIDRTYPVTAQFEDSGGIFTGAQVTYRGIEVGKVGQVKFTQAGVDVRLDLEKSKQRVPADVRAIVANKSAIGEQFVDLQPQDDSAPYLRAGTVIPQSRTAIPVSVTTLLTNVNALVRSVDNADLKTLVDELGAAFEGTGPDLARILDTTSEFIATASDNIDVTRQLIRGSGTVLQTQIDKQGQLATFSDNLAKFSDTLRDADPDLRRLLDEGTSSARTVRQTIDENAVDLRGVISNLVKATEPLARNNKTLAVLAILYPYLLEGAYSVVMPSKDVKQKGEFDATFGLVIPDPSSTVPVCEDGYRDYRGGSKSAAARDLSDRDFDVNIDCSVENTPVRNPKNTTIARNRTSVASEDVGEDGWKWLVLGPASQ